MELKLKNEVVECEICLSDKTKVKVKKNLTTSEIEIIARNMLETNNFIDRQMRKDILILYFCTDIDIKEDENNNIEINQDMYDLYRKNGIIKLVKKHIDKEDLKMIDDYVRYEDSTNKMIENIYKELTNKIDNESKSINIDEMTKTISELLKLQNKKE